MALRQIVETAIAAMEIIRRRICTLSGSYAELPGLPRELKSAAFSSCHGGVNNDRAEPRSCAPPCCTAWCYRSAYPASVGHRLYGVLRCALAQASTSSIDLICGGISALAFCAGQIACALRVPPRPDTRTSEKPRSRNF
jgi:hypothetical protein